jgi:hypothetical protein
MDAIDEKQNITEMVRSFAAANGFARKRQVVESLGITKRQANAAFNTLLEQGFLNRVGQGTYEYLQKPMDGVDAPIEEKVWRAMKISTSFSASELARVAGTTTSYVYKLFRKYRTEGYIEAWGRHTALSGYNEKQWRLTKKGRMRRERPRLKVFEPDPLVVKVVALNKLVCTGMAMRCGEENRKAMRLCGEIVEGLQGLSEEKGEAHAGDA